MPLSDRVGAFTLSSPCPYAMYAVKDQLDNVRFLPPRYVSGIITYSSTALVIRGVTIELRILAEGIKRSTSQCLRHVEVIWASLPQDQRDGSLEVAWVVPPSHTGVETEGDDVNDVDIR